jgi:death-on-curing protein
VRTTRFIPDEIVEVIHADLLRRYGGKHGIRDRHLLASALAQPKMTIGRKFLHRTVFDKAAAYGYHVCRNHPFVDGNKRVAFVLMDLFLHQNSWNLTATEEDAYSTIVTLAAGKLSKTELATWLKAHSSKLLR